MRGHRECRSSGEGLPDAIPIANIKLIPMSLKCDRLSSRFAAAAHGRSGPGLPMKNMREDYNRIEVSIFIGLCCGNGPTRTRLGLLERVTR
jgi:hypothetical protein